MLSASHTRQATQTNRRTKMATTVNPASVSNRIQSLLAQRQQHIDALSSIDQTLGHITKLLNVPASPLNGNRQSSGKVAQPKQQATASKRSGKRSRFALTGDQSVLNFIKKKGGASTQEVKAHWKAEGRGG